MQTIDTFTAKNKVDYTLETNGTYYRIMAHSVVDSKRYKSVGKKHSWLMQGGLTEKNFAKRWNQIKADN
jgi:hypothetical protein